MRKAEGYPYKLRHQNLMQQTNQNIFIGLTIIDFPPKRSVKYKVVYDS